MKLLLIRHAEPDYETDSLTPKGVCEAQLLADRLEKEKIDTFYVSPLGRARMTAQPTLARFGAEGEVHDWLQEFVMPVVRDDGTPHNLPWDLVPAQWTRHPQNFTIDHWQETALSRSGDVEKRYRQVQSGIDTLLKKHGYEREGMYYRAMRSNHDTLAFFCHFGLECVLLSHLLNLPVFALWHGTVSLPTGVTLLATEEREKGIAYFRMQYFGDVSHLVQAGEEPSFSARFCEVFEDETRH